MTGFARADGHEDGASWVWELKSVNSKSLDLRFRLPPGLESLELPLRTSLAQRLKRGALSVTLTVTRGATAAGVRINREALAQVVAASQELVAEGRAALPRADGLLALRGGLESGDEAEDEAQQLLAEGGAIGRRFDFLCQEFNREANTLCSKSADVALTRVGLDLKAVIEQLREQVQNLE